MRKTLTGFVFVLAVLTAVPALAQTPRDRRPYRGLFGSGVSETEQLLAVSFSAGGGYDDDILLGEAGAAQPSIKPISSTLANASAGASYSLTKARGGFSAFGGTSLSYYPELEQSTILYRSGGAGGSYQFSDRTSAFANVFASYQPLHYLSSVPVVGNPLMPAPVTPDSSIPEVIMPDPVPGLPNSTDPVLAFRMVNYLDLSGGAGVGHAFTRRMSGSANYSIRRAQSPTGESFLSRAYGGGIQYRIGRGLGARLGYNLSEAGFKTEDTDSTTRMHQIDAGIDFNNALSLTRRTTLTFRTGVSALKDEVRTHVIFTGNVQVTHELGRTWFLFAGYNRDVSFLETFSHPVLFDSLNGGIGGLINRRLQFQANVGASRGEVGLSGLNNGFTSTFATAGISYGLMRNLGASVVYSYFRYAYELGVNLPPGIPFNSDRQSIRAALNFWAPLFSRSRRANASR